MMNENIKKLHKINIETLKEVLQVCDSFKLNYYMLGGTMLGAIRHKGFIPWDDDIDIGMPRAHYEKFLDIAPQHLNKRLKIRNFKTDPSYHYYITRVLDTNTKVIEIRHKHENNYTHAAIDIFPLDGTPNNKILRKIFIFRVMMHRAMMSLHYKDTIIINANRNPFETLFLKLITKLPTEKIFNANKQKFIIDSLLKRYDMNTSYYSGNLMGAYRTKELFPTSVYGNKSYKFENINLRGIEDFDYYLSQLYGEYMKLPPENQRKIHYELIDLKP
ncbi:LicD family protein [uncultured Draconibacterium sp.]|uniref:LicD family protein n=1 Tax=uncultured Draconibacterium sp. TaxID=1573823 RepID=UPI002AA7B16C|nr:LicD family protein [uncultured Draconibacterium sp.]